MEESQHASDETDIGWLQDIGFSNKAKLEFNVSEYGVSVLGNAEGFLALARFCTFMAEVHSVIRAEDPEFESGEYHLAHYVSAKAIREGRFVFSPGPIKPLQLGEETQDIFFNVSETIGPDYWKSAVESGPAQDWLDESLAFAVQEREDDE